MNEKAKPEGRVDTVPSADELAELKRALARVRAVQRYSIISSELSGEWDDYDKDGRYMLADEVLEAATLPEQSRAEETTMSEMSDEEFKAGDLVKLKNDRGVPMTVIEVYDDSDIVYLFWHGQSGEPHFVSLTASVLKRFDDVRR